jgi:PAS domain S-box-containing protein
MKDAEQKLKDEIIELRRRISELEAGERARRRAEEALRISEREKAAILDSMSEHVVYQDKDMRIAWTNRAAEKSVDLSLENLVGHHCYEIWHGRSEPCKDCPVPRAWETARPQEGEMVTPDGREWLVRGYPVRDADGDITGVVEVTEEITARRKAERALRETNRLLETILASTHMLVAYLDTRFHFIHVNRAYADADERDPSFFPGKNHFDLYPDEENEAIFRRVVETGEPFFAYAKPFVYPEHPERGVSHWDWSLVPIRDPEGEIEGLVLTLANVTDRVRAEKQLLMANERLTYLLSSSSAVLYTARASGDHGATFISENVARMVGYEPRHFIGKSSFWIDHVHPEDRDRVLDEISLIFETNSHACEYRFLHENGSCIWLRDAMRLMRDEDGEPLEIVGFWADITERKRVEEALRESEERYRTLAENIPDIIYSLDQEGRIIALNDAGFRLFGFGKEEVFGRNFVDFLHPEDADRVTRSFLEAIQTRREYTRGLKFRMLGKDGTLRWVELNSHMRFDEKGNYFQEEGVLRDITDRVRMEEELRRLYEQARDDAETKSTLLKEINHRVKNNLSAIIGFLYAQRRRAGMETDVRYQSILQELVGSVQGLATVHNLLSVTSWAPPRLSELASKVIHSSLQILPHDKRVTVEVTPSPVRVTPDQANNLALVLNELTSNAAKHALQDRSRARIGVRIGEEDDRVILEFRDDGPGYPEEVLAGKRRGVGFHLIGKIVSDSLRGEHSLRNDKGAVARLRFGAEAKYCIGEKA